MLAVSECTMELPSNKPSSHRNIESNRQKYVVSSFKGLVTKNEENTTNRICEIMSHFETGGIKDYYEILKTIGLSGKLILKCHVHIMLLSDKNNLNDILVNILENEKSVFYKDVQKLDLVIRKNIPIKVENFNINSDDYKNNADGIIKLIKQFLDTVTRMLNATESIPDERMKSLLESFEIELGHLNQILKNVDSWKNAFGKFSESIKGMLLSITKNAAPVIIKGFEKTEDAVKAGFGTFQSLTHVLEKGAETAYNFVNLFNSSTFLMTLIICSVSMCSLNCSQFLSIVDNCMSKQSTRPDKRSNSSNKLNSTKPRCEGICKTGRACSGVNNLYEGRCPRHRKSNRTQESMNSRKSPKT